MSHMIFGHIIAVKIPSRIEEKQILFVRQLRAKSRIVRVNKGLYSLFFYVNRSTRVHAPQ